MPVYEYTCMKCNERFSVLQSILSSENDTECPGCASKKVKKTIFAFSRTLGSGSRFSPSLSSSGSKGGG